MPRFQLPVKRQLLKETWMPGAPLETPETPVLRPEKSLSDMFHVQFGHVDVMTATDEVLNLQRVMLTWTFE